MAEAVNGWNHRIRLGRAGKRGAEGGGAIDWTATAAAFLSLSLSFAVGLGSGLGGSGGKESNLGGGRLPTVESTG